MVTEPKDRYDVDVCKSWRSSRGCGAAGHRVGDCKQLRNGPTETANNRNNRNHRNNRNNSNRNSNT